MRNQHTPLQRPRTTPPAAGAWDDCTVVVDGVRRPALVTVDGVRRPAREPTDDADDRAWFAAHPRRQYRLRAPLPNESCFRDVPDAAERIEAARVCGCVVLILVWREGHRFVRAPGDYYVLGGDPLARGALDWLTDADIWKMVNNMNEPRG